MHPACGRTRRGRQTQMRHLHRPVSPTGGEHRSRPGMFHSTGVSSAGTAAAVPPVARKAGLGVLTAACVSALVVNANTSAVTILLPAISKDTGAPVSQLQWA